MSDLNQTPEELKTENTELKAQIQKFEDARTVPLTVPQSWIDDYKKDVEAQIRLDDLVIDAEELRAKILDSIQWTLTSLNAGKIPDVDQARVHLRESLEHLNELKTRLQQK